MSYLVGRREQAARVFALWSPKRAFACTVCSQYLLSAVCARAADGRDTQVAPQLGERRQASVNRLADIALRNVFADTDNHEALGYALGVFV